MRKKDYIVIAKPISKDWNSIDQKTEVGQIQAEQTAEIVFALANALKAENPKFNNVLFYRACGLTQGIHFA